MALYSGNVAGLEYREKGTHSSISVYRTDNDLLLGRQPDQSVPVGKSKIITRSCDVYDPFRPFFLQSFKVFRDGDTTALTDIIQRNHDHAQTNTANIVTAFRIAVRRL